MAQRRKPGSKASLAVIILLLIALFVVKQCRQHIPINDNTEQTQEVQQKQNRGLNRYPSAINYSKHARCRMECRHISEAEVKDILENGKINYRKSELDNKTECRRKYAVEGNTADGQRVRIIFAPCRSEVTVVTVIDLGKEWKCDCG